MWSDNETDIDLLQFNYLSTSITRIINSQHLLPTTIGVFGDWGSGKSSLLKMVDNNISKDEKILTINFNGWLFEGFEDAKTALMGTILDQIEEKIKQDTDIFSRAGGLLAKLAKRVNWFQLIGMTGRYALPALVGLPQISAANAGMDAVTTIIEKAKGIDVDEAKKLLKEAPEGEENIRRNIREFRKDFEKLLEASEIKTLVVFVDDLDRCNADTVIETLEAIKLFLFVPRTVFILGADERLIEYAVRRRFPELPGSDAEVGRDYLEKLIQIPVRIPPLSGAENHSYINLLFAKKNLAVDDFEKVCQKIFEFKPNEVSDVSFDIEICRETVAAENIPSELEQDLDLSVQVSPVLTSGLGGNPRRTKRFFNTLLLRMQMAEDRGLKLGRQILAKLMLLEYLRPQFFKQLAQLQANQEGTPIEIKIIEEALSAEKQEKENPVEDLQIKAVLQSKNKDNEKMPAKAVRESKSVKSPDIKKTPFSPTPLSSETLSTELQSWLADPWMKKWLASDPPLSGVDLKSYYYIAHDAVGALGTSQLRLSPIAKRILDKLLNTGVASQKIGLEMTRNISNADAATVFEDLAQRVRQSESLDKSPQKILFSLMSERPELGPQLISLYSSLPETKINLGTIPMLYQAVKDTPGIDAAKSLIERWSNSSNTGFKNAAKAILKHFK